MPTRLRWLARIPDVAVTVLMLLAMADMLAGVFLRYVMTKVAAAFNLPTVSFFWVEEVGEFSLVWLTFIGAAIGVSRDSHFAIHLVTERVSLAARRLIFLVQYALIAAFGLVVAVYGWRVAGLNSQSFSPGLNINLRWLYLSSVAGGLLISAYSVATLARVWRGRG